MLLFCDVVDKKQHMMSNRFDIDKRRPSQWDTHVSDVENELIDHVQHIEMCPAIVVFTDEWECEMFSYYYPRAIICKLMKKITVEDELSNHNPHGHLVSLLYNSADMHSLTIAFYKLAMMCKGKEFNMGDAMTELDSVDVNSIESVFSVVRAWADKPVREAAIKTIQRGIIESVLFERAMREVHNPRNGLGFLRNKRGFQEAFGL